MVKTSPLVMMWLLRFQLCVKMASQKALQKVTTAESLILIESSDVHITTSSLCEGGFTKVTVEFFTLMDSSDVHISTTTGCIDFITEVTAEFFSPMDSSDVVITTNTAFEGSGTFTAAMYFLHFYINTGEVLIVWCLILY